MVIGLSVLLKHVMKVLLNSCDHMMTNYGKYHGTIAT